MNHAAFSVRVWGIVQGVGFRPFVHRVATELCLSGYVKNLGGSEVEIRVEGSLEDIAQFFKKLLIERPPPAKIEGFTVNSVPFNNLNGFYILPSDKRAKAYSMIPPDIAVCDDCLKEVYSPKDRHYRYPFNSCAWCGPRFSMMMDVPYDRDNTAMIDFPMCDECLKEYEDPKNVRRFHAQGISCSKCGPSLWLEAVGGERVETADPISEASKLIDEGEIVAVRGLGGYHIACLATDDEVIKKLRRRKRRREKPFALMALDLSVASKHFQIDERAKLILKSPERPILLLHRKEGSKISQLVAPGLDTVGVMLPYTPLHHMLLNETRDKVLIMTSGNEHNKPMCTSVECARERLRGIADYFLHHNRRIVNRVDDSVVRFTNGRVTMLRRGRGYAPTWIRLPSPLKRAVIAFGAELQNAGAVGFDDKVVLTQYIGDTDELENLEFLDRMLSFFTRIYGIDPSRSVIVADMHPLYSSRKLAEAWAERHGAELVEVQHHHAHVTSVMAELNVPPDGEVVGIAMDGLGYGDDGTFWGGEVLISRYGEYRRFGHLRPQPMPGGDRATRYPVRMLIGILSTFMSESEIVSLVRDKNLTKGLPGGDLEAELSVRQARSSPRISSVGRVLDAISSLLGVCLERTYEGEPAMKLEAFARGGKLLDDLELPLEGGVVDTTYLFKYALNYEGSPEDLAYTSIYAIGYSLGLVALKALNRSSSEVVVATGGAAVNSILIRGVEDALSSEGVSLFLNSKVPAGDGGISLGQVASQLGGD